MVASSLLDTIDAGRMADDLWRLVAIPSPTCRERQAAIVFADMLRDAGADVDIDETLHDSPCVIGRLAGNRPGRTFQLAGHIDHIDVPHAPPRRDSDVISARGAADMKNGLAGILEVVRVLHRGRCDFPGSILVTVYGRHEAPTGDSAGLLNLIERGIVGDVALVTEAPNQGDGVVIAGKGQSVWNITLHRTGAACHELNRPPNADDLLSAALTVAARLQWINRTLQAQPNPYELLSPESLFVGQMHYGDFYNRSPSDCRLQGTRRWFPCRTFAQVQQELQDTLKAIDLPSGITAEADWIFVGESYEIGREEPVVEALRQAHRTVTGKTVGFAGMSAICDSNRLVPFAKVPTVLCGFDCGTAHADCERVRLAKLREPCQIVLQTVLNYLDAECGPVGSGAFAPRQDRRPA